MSASGAKQTLQGVCGISVIDPLQTGLTDGHRNQRLQSDSPLTSPMRSVPSFVNRGSS